ncbi:MAG: DUF3006 domain-containing protein [Armatimonadota bacterium]
MSEKVFTAFIDRIEGDTAVLLREGARIVLPAKLLPDEAGEGSVVTIRIGYEPELTDEATARVRELIERARGAD